MAERGLIHHPDDHPATIVFIENGGRFFDVEACEKLLEIYSRMELAHGELVYTAGYEAVMAGFAAGK